MIPHLPTHRRLGFVWIDGYEFAVTETPTAPAPPPALSRGSEAGAGTPGAT